jgi:hypothetical protein
MQNFMFASDKNKLYTIRKFAKKFWYIRRHVLKGETSKRNHRNETAETIETTETAKTKRTERQLQEKWKIWNMKFTGNFFEILRHDICCVGVFTILRQLRSGGGVRPTQRLWLSALTTLEENTNLFRKSFLSGFFFVNVIRHRSAPSASSSWRHRLFGYFQGG